MPPCAPGADLPDEENSDSEPAGASASSAAVHTIRTRQFRITKEQVKALMGGKRKVVDAMCSVKSTCWHWWGGMVGCIMQGPGVRGKVCHTYAQLEA